MSAAYISPYLPISPYISPPGARGRPRSVLSGSAPRGVGADLLFGAFGTPSRPKNPSPSTIPNLYHLL